MKILFEKISTLNAMNKNHILGKNFKRLSKLENAKMVKEQLWKNLS